MESLCVFDDVFKFLINTEIKSVLVNNATEEINVAQKTATKWTPPDRQKTLSCSCCRVQFDDTQQQREHYKLDWHRYNLSRKKEPLTEEEFNEKNTKDDISSISGSDSEEESDGQQHAITAKGIIYLQNTRGRVFSIHTALIGSNSTTTNDTLAVGSVLQQTLYARCVTNRQWAVLMLAAGHFAGAIFHGRDILHHRTLHYYTVRAGQGAAQTHRDARNAHGAPRSAGATLRRHNELVFAQRLRDVLDGWRAELERCSVIFYRAAGGHNAALLFGPAGVLDKNDTKRLRTIPFATRRPTLAEVRRVHGVLVTARVYASLEVAVGHFEAANTVRNNKQRKNEVVGTKKIEEKNVQELCTSVEEVEEDDVDEVEEDVDLVEEFEEITFSEDLELFGDSLTPEQRNSKQKRKKPRKRTTKAKQLKENNLKRLKHIQDALIKGDCKSIEEMCRNDNRPDGSTSEEATTAPPASQSPTFSINEILDEESGNTALHVAALNEHVDLIECLLKMGADPTVRNRNQLTPYGCTKSGDVRTVFRQFACANPVLYNYNKAHIPTTTVTAETAERRASQKKAKRERCKMKRVEMQAKINEDAEKERFLRLSDREKMALAAEKRILKAQQNGGVVVLVRCFQCGVDISGKVPFEYLNNRFCTIDCLKTHRMKVLK